MAMPIFQQRPVDNIHLPSSVFPVVEFIDTFFVRYNLIMNIGSVTVLFSDFRNRHVN